MMIDGAEYPAQQITAAGLTLRYCRWKDFWVYMAVPEGADYPLRSIANPIALFETDELFGY